MMDREKVINGLEEVIAEAVYPDRPRKFMMSLELAEDALALLKAQEPIAVQKKPVEMCGLQTWDWTCGNCGNTVLYKANYCSCCGQAVKWDG